MTKTIFCLLLATCMCFCSKNNATPASVPSVTMLNADFAHASPEVISGKAYEGNLYLPYSGGNGAAFDQGNAISSSGVTGLTAVLQKGVLENGVGSVVYKITGTPSAAGIAVFNISFAGQSATVNVAVTETQSPVVNNLYWGFFDDSGTPMSFYEGFGKKPSMAMMFDAWTITGNKDFPIQFCRNADAAGYVPHVTWEPMMGLTELMSGNYDEDIRKYGEAMAAFGKPIVLRFAHEFNGDWYPWSIFNDELVPAATYVQGFRYVHDKIKATGATNVYWTWAPNNANGNNNPQTLDVYYPGDDYVDIIGMDGYNFGTSQSWSRWQSFGEVYSNVYSWITQNHPGKPIIICEMGTSSTGGNKAAWITDMFIQLETNFPQVKGFVWFNIDKETNWLFNETEASTNAFKAALSSPRVVTDRSFGGILK